MKVLEWQAKELVAHSGIRVPEGRVVETAGAAGEVAARLGRPVMVKAQLRIGGRGKAGGILQAPDALAAVHAAEVLLGSEIRGRIVRQLLVEEQIDAVQELYIGFTVDYDARRPVLLLSSEGGMDVEGSPARGVARAEINPLLPLPGYVVRSALAAASITRTVHPALVDIANRLYRLFQQRDATLLEINPLLVMANGAIVAADARMVIDDAAIGRQPALAKFADSFPDLSESEQIKLKHGFDYIDLDQDGNIGLISTGAGGTMTTIDMLSRAGGRVINFADVRTGMIGRDPSRLVVILDQLARKPAFRVLLVNIFGAITDLGEFAEALLSALRIRPISAEVIVRLKGRNEEAAREMLLVEGLIVQTSLEQAVNAAVALAREGQL